MKTRIVAGISAAFVTIGLIYWAPIEVVMLTVALCAVLSYLEFDKLFFNGFVWTRQVGLSMMVLLTLITLRQSLELTFLLFGFFYLLLAVIHVVRSSLNQSMQEVFQHFAIELVGYIYVSGLFGFIVPILEIPGHGKDYLMLLFLIVFVGDSAAYFIGKKWGKRSLASKVSPKKTIEGALAAVLSSFLVVCLWVKFFYGGVGNKDYVIKLLLVAPFLSVLAQIGDLFESVLKRSQGQKDSGTFLPGHGGILDRVDGLAFSAPIFYFYVTRVLEKP